ncbi:MAG: glycosyltransferase family 2 protein [Candidatus Omnitrophica bacterium]|nr:glycosyltransferase family 2 protein [Candidatus Omnitrophota bacterium]MCG2703992.1 glycosyltransferase family 2 protein [Candidatus Omnitrophota bacterium]
MKLCVLLPAFNEEKNISEVIREIKKIIPDVVVVDDGSADATARFAEEAGAIVLRHAGNEGKGHALRTGFRYVIENNYAAAIILDSDGQHAPQEIKKFIAYAQGSDAGVIIGNRMGEPEGMPLIRKLTNIVTSYFVSKIAGYRIPDSQCGYRLIKTEVLKAVKLSTEKYDTESEILIEAARNNFRIESIPVKSIYANQKSQIRPVIDTLRFWKLIFRNLLKKNKNAVR